MKDIEIMDNENTLETDIAEPEEKAPEEKKKKKSAVRRTIKKAVAVGVGAGLLTVGAVAALDNLPEVGSGAPQFNDPAPVVLEIDETDMDTSEDSEEEQQEEKKRGFFNWLKIWFYGLIGGIAAFFATKIPWKKIFTKRNFIILLVLVVLFLCAKYILPYYMDVPWGPDQAAQSN
jgi:hypothetical protein